MTNACKDGHLWPQGELKEAEWNYTSWKLEVFHH